MGLGGSAYWNGFSLSFDSNGLKKEGNIPNRPASEIVLAYQKIFRSHPRVPGGERWHTVELVLDGTGCSSSLPRAATFFAIEHEFDPMARLPKEAPK